MKVIIDIDDNVYEWVKNTGTFGIYRFNTAKAIKNGTPLPKGHGRLIDADALNRKDVNCANVPMNFIDTALTIVKADKE